MSKSLGNDRRAVGHVRDGTGPTHCGSTTCPPATSARQPPSVRRRAATGRPRAVPHAVERLPAVRPVREHRRVRSERLGADRARSSVRRSTAGSSPSCTRSSSRWTSAWRTSTRSSAAGASSSSSTTSRTGTSAARAAGSGGPRTTRRTRPTSRRRTGRCGRVSSSCRSCSRRSRRSCPRRSTATSSSK